MMVGRMAGRQARFSASVCGGVGWRGEAEAHQQVWIKPVDRGARERERRKGARERNLKALRSKVQTHCMTK